MRITVPIYVQQRRDKGSAPINAQPLFFAAPDKSGSDLGRVIAGITDRLRVLLAGLAREPNHKPLMRWHCPETLEYHTTKLHLDLSDSTAKLRLLMVVIRRENKTRWVFSPSIPDLWFDVRGDEDIDRRATEVYEEYFRAIRKEEPQYKVGASGIKGKAWIDYVTIDVLPSVRPPKKVDPLRAFLGGQDVSDGAGELRKTGRCLNWIDIDQLASPIGVGTDVKGLCKLLEVGDRRGVVLVGPAGSGKTARIEGAVRRRRGEQKSSVYGQVWNLSPARLISGMSYLGQWQERVLSIFRHAHRYDHVLYFEDLLGLFEAGKTRDSAMCVADTLRAQLDVYPFRVLAEMTPEAWAILREKDRALADRFVVMPTKAMDADQSLEIMIGVKNRLEAKHRCRFDLGVLPEVISLYDRFERSSVLPGKAVAAIERLASRAREKDVVRQDALNEFQSRSGLEPAIIDRHAKIDRDLIRSTIRRQVVGQDQAVESLIDRILVAAARMNDPNRPLGTYLLVGPTGVGKTQLAKAVASCLFDEEGLIRLDMNELASPSATSRLVGTFDAPDGLLTSAVRRRPNAVLLLDEIEKAHPSVLDVLLQALGEARLSDARGRTVDMSGLLILMTSNLGSRESGRGRGFGGTTEDTIAESHLRAARDFFRPEFFNRIDDVLSFHRLSPEVMQSIALMQFRDVLSRDGLQRRSVLIDVDPNAIRETAARGYDPAMGARALKRQIEQDLVQPAAEVLAATKTDQPTMLRLYLDGKTVRTKWQPIDYEKKPAPQPELSIEELCGYARGWLDDVAEKVDGGPLSFEVGVSGVDTHSLETMTLRDSLQQCYESLRVLEDAKSRPRMDRAQPSPVPQPRAKCEYGVTFDMRDVRAISDIEDYMRETLIERKPGELDDHRDRLIDDLSRLKGQLKAQGSSSTWLVWLRWFGEELATEMPVSNAIFSARLRAAFEHWLVTEEDLLVEPVDAQEGNLFKVSGALGLASVEELAGGWMVISGGRMSMSDVRIRPVTHGQSIENAVQGWQAEIIREAIAPVRRVIQRNQSQVDLRTGHAVKDDMGIESITKLLNLSRRVAPLQNSDSSEALQ